MSLVGDVINRNCKRAHAIYSDVFETCFYRQLFEQMCLKLGGRVAESLIFNSVTTGSFKFHIILSLNSSFRDSVLLGF